jgi:hypothetical protein
MKKYFYFGEKVHGYDVPVLNEREARAWAGILFLFAMIAFFNAFLVANFYWIQLFVLAFLVDFIIRVLINPKYAPSLVIARWIVNNQLPEYVGAPQKRFARAIGLVLATVMTYLIVIQGMTGPVNLIVCLFCLFLLFFETAFGICVGCKIYNLIYPDQAKYCPGGVCQTSIKQAIQKIDIIQRAVLLLMWLWLIALHTSWVLTNKTPIKSTQNCIIPERAKVIGHEEMYKLHHGCRKQDS